MYQAGIQRAFQDKENVQAYESIGDTGWKSDK